MTSKGMQDDYLKNGGIPSRSSSLEDRSNWGKHPYYKATLDTLSQADDLGKAGHSVVVRIPEWGKISDVMGTDGARAFIGEISPEQAMLQIQDKVEKIFD